MKIPPLWLPGKKGNKKALIPKLTLGTRTENKIFCGTTLFAAEATTSCRCQHIRCQITPALRQKILGPRLSPCPRRPICRSAYRPALSHAGLSVGALPTLLPPQRFPIELGDTLPYCCPFVKHFFSRGKDKFQDGMHPRFHCRGRCPHRPAQGWFIPMPRLNGTSPPSHHPSAPPLG